MKTFNKRFRNLTHKVIFSNNISQWALRGGWYFSTNCKKNAIFQAQIRGWVFIRAWAFIRMFTVCSTHSILRFPDHNIWHKKLPFFKLKLGDGCLLEHGRLLKCLQYVLHIQTSFAAQNREK